MKLVSKSLIAEAKLSSLPSRERGLKLKSNRLNHPLANVAPLAGAWIETSYTGICSTVIWSLPSRERGLKQFYVNGDVLDESSLPSRERGLKLQWGGCKRTPDIKSLPSRERGLKQIYFGESNKIRLSLPSRERGLKLKFLSN